MFESPLHWIETVCRPGFDLEVDSVAHLWITAMDECDVEGEVVNARLAAGSLVASVTGSASGIVTGRAPVVADAV